MSDGWICPKCGAVYNLMVSECRRCNALVDLGMVATTAREPSTPPMTVPPGRGCPMSDQQAQTSSWIVGDRVEVHPDSPTLRHLEGWPRE